MSDIAVALLGFTGTLLAVIISYALGQRAERKKQSLFIRSEMLKPIEDWLKGAEKLVRLLGDKIHAMVLDQADPSSNDFEERRRAAIFISENTNIVIGILDSKSLQTPRTRKLAAELEISILTIEQAVKYQLLPAESEIIGQTRKQALTQETIRQAGELKLKLENELQNAYKLIANIKTSLA
jgi:hypothetical protein